MAVRHHHYTIDTEWTGNRGTGTSRYDAYGRDHVMRAKGKPDILGSADPHFRGDAARWNPEELLVAALSACHELSYLHMCAVNGVVVIAYSDEAEGWMDDEKGAGEFTRVLLKPRVTITAQSNAAMARELHHQAHENCFIARSVDFPVEHAPVIVKEGD